MADGGVPSQKRTVISECSTYCVLCTQSYMVTKRVCAAVVQSSSNGSNFGWIASGNVIFLPKGASIIDISPVNHEDKPAWVFFMAADFHALKYNPIRIPEQRAVPMLHKLKAYKQWHQLTPAWRYS